MTLFNDIRHKSNNLQSRSYESEDENVGRKRTRPSGTKFYPKPSVYSRGDIREQVKHLILVSYVISLSLSVMNNVDQIQKYILEHLE